MIQTVRRWEGTERTDDTVKRKKGWNLEERGVMLSGWDDRMRG